MAGRPAGGAHMSAMSACTTAILRISQVRLLISQAMVMLTGCVGGPECFGLRPS
jgi:hypothetical protein